MTQMKDRTLMLGAGAVIAIGIIWNRKEELMHNDNEDFREGYVAGFFTPGPFTILAITGLVAFHA